VCSWRGLPLVLLGAEQRQDKLCPRMFLHLDSPWHRQRSSSPLLLLLSKGHLGNSDIRSDLCLSVHIRPLQLLHQPGGEERVVEAGHNQQTSYKADNEANNDQENNNNETNNSGSGACRTTTKAGRTAWQQAEYPPRHSWTSVLLLWLPSQPKQEMR